MPSARNSAWRPTALNPRRPTATWSSRHSSRPRTTGNGRSGSKSAEDLCAQLHNDMRENRNRLDGAAAPSRRAAPGSSVHWEIEFPEVFDRENPGFDAFVGNPPFAGKNT